MMTHNVIRTQPINNLVFVLAIAFALLVCASGVEGATTWHVDDDFADYPDANFTDVQDAVDASRLGDTISVYPGTYHEIDLTIEPDRKVIISEGAILRTKDVSLQESANLTLMGILIAYRTNLEKGAKINICPGGQIMLRAEKFLVVDEARTDNDTYSLNERVEITCVVLDDDGRKVLADVTAEIEKPDGLNETISLSETQVDNYKGNFTNTSLAGTYKVAIRAEKEGYINHTVWLRFKVKPVPVLLVHGYYSNHEMWVDMKAFLKNNGYEDEDIFTIDLAPGPAPANGDIRVYAKRLSQEIDYIRADHDGEYEIDKVDLVTHSMGGLVSRWYTTHGYHNNVRRLIMIGTPNHGSELLCGPHAIFLFPILGTAGRQMTPHSPFLNTLNYGAWWKLWGNDKINQNIQHEVIAGTDDWGFTTWIFLWDDNDGVVRVESARLDGETLQTVPYDHLKECHENEVFEKVLAILRGGSGLGQHAQQTPPAAPLVPPQEAPAVFGTINSGEEKSHKIPITSTSEVRFVLAWQEQEGDLNLTLTTPSGRQINSSFAANETNTTYYSDEDLTIEGYEIKNPEQGIWSLNVTAVNISGEENYTIMTFLNTNTTLSLSLQKYQYYPNEPVNITTNLSYGCEAITNAFVTTNMKRPDDTIETIIIYDDGLHNDNKSNDGIYANTYTNTSLWGTYDITVTASGIFNEEQFERVVFTTIWVEQYPDLTLNASDISFSSETPTVGENITINATIHNIGEANATNASILFYDGNPADGTTIGEDVVNVSVNATANASVSWVAKAGVHEICALISPYNKFLEENYTNNRANKTIEVNIRGDLNGDGILTAADAVIVLQLAASGGWDADADVSGDGRVTSLDALMILQAAVGKIGL
ncbi:MAG: hypothetical protein GIS02_06220 [Methanosarcinales archaeon]|uniref:Dockerin domain-containing protein n=1 Tax=Candidatus Ethanoperedens thermophilum TaxID=2766897 RepID=A0A848DAJ4_9EURY|nr:hypothetical protein [Candidatus Ethanoperedens thermophilum]